MNKRGVIQRWNQSHEAVGFILVFVVPKVDFGVSPLQLEAQKVSKRIPCNWKHGTRNPLSIRPADFCDLSGAEESIDQDADFKSLCERASMNRFVAPARPPLFFRKEASVVRGQRRSEGLFEQVKFCI